MSTRSMTLVEQSYSGKNEFIPLYRHCDGYPAEAGATIAEALMRAPTCAEDVLCYLLGLRYDGHGGHQEPHYRAATWMPNEQGDLEHVYIIERACIDADGGGVRPAVREWTVTHFDRGHSEAESFRDWPHTTHGLASWIAAVNRDRAQSNARLRLMQREHPHMREWQGYEMLIAPAVEVTSGA